jgi:hypothetical protein
MAETVLSDAEVICGWMETKLSSGPFDYRPWRSVSPRGWWTVLNGRKLSITPNEWYPVDLTLDRLWEVEERLTDEQRQRYSTHLAGCSIDTLRRCVDYADLWDLHHATVSQKIAALATVLRGTSITCPATGAQPKEK